MKWAAKSEVHAQEKGSIREVIGLQLIRNDLEHEATFAQMEVR